MTRLKLTKLSNPFILNLTCWTFLQASIAEQMLGPVPWWENAAAAWRRLCFQYSLWSSSVYFLLQRNLSFVTFKSLPCTCSNQYHCILYLSSNSPLVLSSLLSPLCCFWTRSS